MKSFIAKHGLQLSWSGKIPYYFDGKYCVLGDYSKDGCCGPDRLGGKDVIYEYLLFLRDTFRPEWLMFEQVMLSSTFRFANVLRKTFDGRYGAILLDADIKEIFRQIAIRNGGKKINEKGLFDMYVAFKKAGLKMKYAGFYVEKVNPFSYSKEDMHQIIDGFIERYDQRI